MTHRINFWDSAKLASKYAKNNALVEIGDDKTRFVTYLQLHQLITQAKTKLSTYHRETPLQKQLIMIQADHSIETIVYYFAALQLSHVVWWVDKNSSVERLSHLQNHYCVNLFINEGNITKLSDCSSVLHPELAVLLTTSGSTGSPTLVRLSYQNLTSNCIYICQALSLQASDTTISTLPLHYSFGLSIVHTHLYSGSTIVLNDASVVSREFWGVIKQHDIKSVYGVPHTFDMLLRLGLSRLPLKSLRFMAVAGGKLSPDKVKSINDYCLNNNSHFYVMYGQTEATARIAILSPEKTRLKPYAIGQAITGKLWLENQSGQEIITSNSEGELCFQGDNVMMGYAETGADLALPAHLSVLRTGDIAQFDDDGDFQIVGRLKRIVKVVGHRINLDEIEQFFSKQNQAVVCTGQDDLVCCYLLVDSSTEQYGLEACQQSLSQFLSIHSSYFRWFCVDHFPYLPSGKVNYQQLEKTRREKENK